MVIILIENYCYIFILLHFLPLVFGSSDSISLEESGENGREDPEPLVLIEVQTKKLALDATFSELSMKVLLDLKKKSLVTSQPRG